MDHERTNGDDATEGPGNVTVDEPTEPALNPEDDDLDEDGSASKEANRLDDSPSK